MFDDPSESPAEDALDPSARAREKSDEFRMHAELVAVFEGHRKFGSRILPKFNANVARDIQRTVARLEKSRPADNPILLEPDSVTAAANLLSVPQSGEISTNDYHLHRRPGEVMIVRWLAGDQVESFYERLQAHFDIALNQYREEERQALGWKQESQTGAYLDALDKIDLKMADRYLREPIRRHNIIVLSTQTADELDIVHLCDYVMGADPAEIVGQASAPPEEPTEQDRAWFFKLFALRGMIEGVERMCFFAYLQKTDEDA